ncbi:alpha/beta fold hydrolase [Polymorphobacter fuscus]|uniref:Alpha/beta fold hydrolase n=1 Tax=Sandarakinorhabdus fusca TaxID=1439888 RepID=A0A7C9GWL4_9SPHN|nr:alpha/beta hydrolase [Polymorphobacter fuscus]KAB7644399.1 alpha/beta hydrolase [Polymorphobacter fuscus]MQT18318.1 alpha/beta fold hydrolase [Polymorphobacter fuscus]NJC08217.1 pimeloyl-ACP methyl ester carboxylesterase [Polymorphobacter fuscus]
MSDTQTGPDPLTSYVLVHGAFVDGSGWKMVHDQLSARGHEVLVVQNPTTTLEGDVALTERAIAAAQHPVVLVGHSYGGAVVTEAGTHPKVKAIAYIAAFVPDAGESVAALNEAPAEAGEHKAPVLPPEDGYLIVDPAKFPEAFAVDVDPAITRFMAASQVPWGLGAVMATVGRVGWRVKPTFYMVAAADRMVPPSAQRNMANRAGARVSEIDSGHAVMLSHPREVTDFIVAAAASAG